MIYKEITKCRVCGMHELEPIIGLGMHALHCRYPKPGETVPEAPVELVICADCSQVQLKHTVDPREMYRPGYGYRSGINRTMREHFERLIDQIGSPSEGMIVLDIGCNDGTLLKMWPERATRIGFDPIGLGGPGVTVYNEYFTAESFLRRTGGKKAKIITSLAMLYDVNDPVKFCRDVGRCLADDGVWIIEVLDAEAMFKGAWDQLSHEHLCYFDLWLLRRLIQRAGLSMFNYDSNPLNGGTIRIFVEKHDHGQWVPSQAERTVASWARFGKRVTDSLNAIHAMLLDTRQSETIAILGASQKGNTILQSLMLPDGFFKYAVERNPEKVGLLTPGTNIPIISEEDARRNPPDMYLVLPWHFREEIIEREADYLKQGGKLLFPLPTPEIVTAETLGMAA